MSLFIIFGFLGTVFYFLSLSISIVNTKTGEEYDIFGKACTIFYIGALISMFYVISRL